MAKGFVSKEDWETFLQKLMFNSGENSQKLNIDKNPVRNPIDFDPNNELS